MKYESDGMVVKAKVSPTGDVKVTAIAGFVSNVDVLLELKDNANGYYVKFPSYSSVEPDRIMNLDYAELAYLYVAYKAILKKEKNNEYKAPLV